MPMSRAAPPLAGGFYDAYVCLRDVKAQNTNGGTFTSGAWQIRDLTEELADTADICVLDEDYIFMLPAGTYRCLITCPAYQVNQHQARLLDYFAGPAVALLGASAQAGAGDATPTHAIIQGPFTLANEGALVVQHQCSQTKADTGFGPPANFTNEIYTVVELWREAETP